MRKQDGFTDSEMEEVRTAFHSEHLDALSTSQKRFEGQEGARDRDASHPAALKAGEEVLRAPCMVIRAEMKLKDAKACVQKL